MLSILVIYVNVSVMIYMLLAFVFISHLQPDWRSDKELVGLF